MIFWKQKILQIFKFKKLKKKEEKPLKSNPPIFFPFFSFLWGRKIPQSVTPFHFFFFLWWVEKGIFYHKFLLFEKSLEIANRNQFFWRGCGHIHMYRALATYSIWETCRQANVNVPRDARHPDSIRKLGKKKKKKH
jgi:hypothetical protein